MMLNMYCRPFDLDDELNSGVMLSNHANATPIPAPRHCRRRLEDPVQTQISNYYALYPDDKVPVIMSLLRVPPIPLPRKIYRDRRLEMTDAKLELFDRFEPCPPVLPRKKNTFMNTNSSKMASEGGTKNRHTENLLTDPDLILYDQSAEYEEIDDSSVIDSSMHYCKHLKGKWKFSFCVHGSYPVTRESIQRLMHTYFCIPTVL